VVLEAGHSILCFIEKTYTLVINIKRKKVPRGGPDERLAISFYHFFGSWIDAIGLALGLFYFGQLLIYDKKKILEFCEKNNLKFRNKIIMYKCTGELWGYPLEIIYNVKGQLAVEVRKKNAILLKGRNIYIVRGPFTQFIFTYSFLRGKDKNSEGSERFLTKLKNSKSLILTNL